jgi:hypothetical protein
MKRTTRKLEAFACENGKNTVMECNVILEPGKHRARAVPAWFPNTGASDIPSVELNLDPRRLEKAWGYEFDYFNRDKIDLPPAEPYAEKKHRKPVESSSR